MRLIPHAFQKLTILAFILALIAPAVAVASSDGVRGSIAAVIKTPASWPEESNRLRAATPLWNNAVASYSTLLYRLGSSSNDGFGVMGRDGWMFLGDVQNANFAQALGRRLYEPWQVDQWATQVDQEAQWLGSQGIPMALVVGPAKWSVYSDKMPAWSDDLAKDHIFDQVLRAHPELPLIDLRQALRDGRSTADTYSPLNSHWTDYGAAVGWGALAPRLEELLGGGVSLRVPEVAGVRVIDTGNEFESTMAIRAVNPWTVPDLATPLPPNQIVLPDGSLQEVPGSKQTGLLELPRVMKSPTAGNDLTALILRDSMGDSISPYWQSAFGTTIQVRHNIDSAPNAPSVEALVATYQPDIVIYEMAERHFNSGLSDSESWIAANAYDNSDRDSERGWVTGDATVTGLTMSGPPDLSEPSTLSWAAAAALPEVLRLTLDAQGPAQLIVTGSDGATQTLRVAPGANIQFARLPAGAGERSFSVALAPDSAPVTLTSAAVRTSRP